ncbi:MAG: hypothetical protein JST53_00850 [Actinobacteria bacterium]|nr:hypothetical protein [Actinomycetota bacterium]
MNAQTPTTITLDRARALANAAVAAGLAQPPRSDGDGYTYSAELRAMLGEYGADLPRQIAPADADALERDLLARVPLPA